jgi:hypothetical protein
MKEKEKELSSKILLYVKKIFVLGCSLTYLYGIKLLKVLVPGVRTVCFGRAIQIVFPI